MIFVSHAEGFRPHPEVTYSLAFGSLRHMTKLEFKKFTLTAKGVIGRMQAVIASRKAEGCEIIQVRDDEDLIQPSEDSNYNKWTESTDTKEGESSDIEEESREEVRMITTLQAWRAVWLVINHCCRYLRGAVAGGRVNA